MPNINIKDRRGNTQLHRAALTRNIKLAEILIKKEANVNLKNCGDQTPLDLALTEQMLDFQDFLPFKSRVKEHQKKEINLLESQSQTMTMAHLLIINGAQINPECVNSMRALCTFVLPLKSNPHFFDCLSNAGIVGPEDFEKVPELQNIFYPSNLPSQKFPLHLAVRHKFQLTKKLIRSGANPNAEDEMGRTPVYIALEQNNISEEFNCLQILQILIQSGALLGFLNDKKETTIQYPLQVTWIRIPYKRLILSSEIKGHSEVDGYQCLNVIRLELKKTSNHNSNQLIEIKLEKISESDMSPDLRCQKCCEIFGLATSPN